MQNGGEQGKVRELLKHVVVEFWGGGWGSAAWIGMPGGLRTLK